MEHDESCGGISSDEDNFFNSHHEHEPKSIYIKTEMIAFRILKKWYIQVHTQTLLKIG